MPKQKDLKRLIRTRMEKTGESYTAARARLLKLTHPVRAEFAKLAGMGDEAVRAKTGMTWSEWVDELDRVDATAMTHRQIAKHVGDSYDVSGWWAQTVTVGYERIRGLRAVGQKRADQARGGTWDASKSKTFAMPVSKLYKQFATKRLRERWLPGVDLTIRTSTVDKSIRMTWPDGTSVNAWFTDKGPDKSSVSISHVGLAAKKDVERSKTFWAERLGELAKAT